MLHGGDLAAADAAFGRPEGGWLDLSTGINPHPYPLPPFKPEHLVRAPEPAEVTALTDIARAAYGWRKGTPVVAGPGAQAMIQLLPYLRPRGSVAVIGDTYAEHAYVWARAAHQVRVVSETEKLDADVVVVVNPDTPSGRIWAPEKLEEIASSLTARDGLLVIDETYADVAPEAAYGERLTDRGVVVLRSFGKFFGLAGLRLGFAAGDAEMVNELAGELGPWPVSGPALAAGRLALSDEAWIATTRLRLTVDAMRLDSLLREAGLGAVEGCDLFRTATHRSGARVHGQLAARGVLCRHLENAPTKLRFGLPASDEAFQKLESALFAVFRARVKV